MSENEDIRWKQRFRNYEKAFKLLERTLEIKEPSEAEMGEAIRFYEMSLELAWKTLKDYYPALRPLNNDLKSEMDA